MTAKMVKVTYASRIGKTAIAKRLFGYKSWKTKVGTKVYVHKPIRGALEGIPVRRLGRGTIVLPQQYLSQAKTAIEDSRGLIKSIEPVIMDPEGNKRITSSMFRSFAEGIIGALLYASETETKDLYLSALEKAISMTRKFELFIGEFDEYNSLNADSQLLRTLSGLKSLAEQDFDGAKMQAIFFAREVQKSTDHILK